MSSMKRPHLDWKIPIKGSFGLRAYKQSQNPGKILQAYLMGSLTDQSSEQNSGGPDAMHFGFFAKRVPSVKNEIFLDLVTH